MNYNAYPWGRWIKWVVLAVVVLIVLTSGISTYNSLAAANQDVSGKWSQVQNVMQARADKITNLVEVVKGYTKHEEKVFADVAAARAVLQNPAAGVKSKLDADSSMTGATQSILALVENYPELKADQQYHDLSIAIEGAENRVAVERKRFIDSVQDYNTRVTRFPGSIFAKLMGYGQKDYFEAGKDAQQSPDVKF